MGTQIAVASTLQNLAGEEGKRVQYLQQAILGHVLTESTESLSTTISKSYLNGPGVKLKRFFNWANTPGNYDAIGVPSASLGTIPKMDGADIVATIPVEAGQFAKLIDVQVGAPNFTYWAARWLSENDPDMFGQDWTADLTSSGDIVITYPDDSLSTFTPTDFTTDGIYFYITYSVAENTGQGTITYGSQVALADTATFPDISGYTTMTNQNNILPITLRKQTVTETTNSSGTTTTTTYEDRLENYVYVNTLYYKDVYTSSSGSTNLSTALTRHYRTWYRSVSVSTGDPVVTTITSNGVTITKTVTDQYLTPVKWYRDDTQPITSNTWSKPKVYIYKAETGNEALDDLLLPDATMDGEYFPFIPLRLDNLFTSERDPTVYAQAQAAAKKAFGADLNTMMDELNASPSIADIDYAYVAFGVPVNTKEQAGLKYIYKYLKKVTEAQTDSSLEYQLYLVQLQEYNEAMVLWNEWYNAQLDEGSGLYGTPSPAYPSKPFDPRSGVWVKSDNMPSGNYNMEILWSSLKVVSGTDVDFPEEASDIAVGDYGFVKGNMDTLETVISDLKDGTLVPGGRYLDALYNTRIYHRISATRWEALECVNLLHRNHIYAGRYVETTLEQGLLTTDEDSGFLVPLHYPTFQECGMVSMTQMSTCCCYLVINCYVVKKTSFLTDLLTLVIVIVVIIAIVLIAPQASPGTVNAVLALGTAVGLTGIAAIIVGAIIFGVISFAANKLITAAAVEVFGEKLGTILGTVLSFAAMNYGSSLANGTSFAANFHNFLNAANILKLTSTALDVYTKFIAFDTRDIMQNISDMQEKYASESKKINALYEQNIGYGNGMLSAAQLADYQSGVIESPDTFFTRTLLTGTEVAELTHTMLDNFASITTSTELAGV